MRKIEIEITGTSPLLMNSPKGMITPKEKVSSSATANMHDFKKEAENVAYRTDKGFLYVPSTAIKGTMINASSFKKAGKFALKPLVAGGVKINPSDEILLQDLKGRAIKNYEVDLRTIVNPSTRGRSLKARPKIKDWKLSFDVDYNESMIGDSAIIKQVLTEAGERVGILDFRPQKTGDFGCFKITKWKEK